MVTTRTNRHGGQGRTGLRAAWARVASAALLVLATALICTSPATAQQADATIGQIIDNPEQFYGRVVTLHGLLHYAEGNRTFWLQDPDIPAADRLLIVLSARRPALGDSAGALLADEVQIAGVVRRFDRSMVERITATNVSDDLLLSAVGAPMIVAQSVRPYPLPLGSAGQPPPNAPVHQPGLIPAPPPQAGTPYRSVVIMRDLTFQPRYLYIAAGTTVVWENQDDVPHTIIAGRRGNPRNLFDSGIIQPGERFALTFEQEGFYQYYCQIHVGMEGAVSVE